MTSMLTATEVYAYCLDYLQFISRYGFPKLNATYHFIVKSMYSKNKLVILTTEWLPWLQSSWRDCYERFALV